MRVPQPHLLPPHSAAQPHIYITLQHGYLTVWILDRPYLNSRRTVTANSDCPTPQDCHHGSVVVQCHKDFRGAERLQVTPMLTQ